MNKYLIRAQKISERINELGAISEDENCLTRTFGSAAFITGRDKVLSWMNEACLKTKSDNIGNARGILLSYTLKAKTFFIFWFCFNDNCSRTICKNGI